MHIWPLLILHVSGGITGILSGAVTMFFRKGSRGHRLSGNVFFISMLCMASAGALMAFLKFQFMNVESQITNVFAGTVTFYLVATAWSAARRKDGETGLSDWGGLLVALAVGVGMVTFGVEALQSPTGSKYGYPPALYFIWAFVTLMSAAGDSRLLLRGGVFFGSQRIVRHLWRMTFSWFIATGSFFLGQQKVFPASLRGLKVWFVPAFLPLLLLIFWLFRVWFTKTYKKTPSPYQVPKGPAAFRKLTVAG
ncbi:MAG TPA: hypothetical protein VIX89_03360 [Bryobacteraceae bacterium]